MTDAAPREGWYAITSDAGSVDVAFRFSDGWSVPWHEGVLADIPPGWTLGPRIDDLLRDAARYRWCRENITCFYIREENVDRNAATPEDFGELIDAEIAREKGRADGCRYD